MQLLIIMQGASGSGKSTKAKKLKELIPNTYICSTDYYHYNDKGVYEFKADKLAEYHKDNYARTKRFLEEGANVIVDNTNIQCWQVKPYVEMALEMKDIEIIFIRCNGNYENIHGVPKEKVQSMIQNLELLTIENCLNSKSPIRSKNEYINSRSK